MSEGMERSQRTVLVTGASGFVGRHLAAELEHEGWTVRRAVRTSSGLENEILIGSIGSRTNWDRAVEGVDAVVHLAARVHQRNDRGAEQLYREVNTAGTLHLAQCAAAAGARQFIFASTVLVYGRSNDGRPAFKEDDTLTPLGFYGSSKAEAEAGLKSFAQKHDMGITVVRPPLVYGLGAKGNFASLIKAVKIGLPLPLAAIRNQRAFVSVQNLSSFVAFCLGKPMSGFEVFLVADNEQVSTPEFIRRLAVAAGSRASLFAIPSPLLSALLQVAGLSSARESLLGSLQLDISKAHSTGWHPPFSLDQGLREALQSAN